MDLHRPEVRVADVRHVGTCLELDRPGLVPRAADTRQAVRGRRTTQKRRPVEMEVVERRVVVDLDGVRAGRDSVELVDQRAVRIPHLDDVVVLDVSGENGIPRRSSGAVREGRAADQHADCRGERRSGYVTSLHPPPPGMQANPFLSYAKEGRTGFRGRNVRSRA